MKLIDNFKTFKLTRRLAKEFVDNYRALWVNYYWQFRNLGLDPMCLATNELRPIKQMIYYQLWVGVY